MSTNCPNDCYGKGDCEDGVCKCYHGYRGVGCNLSELFYFISKEVYPGCDLLDKDK